MRAVAFILAALLSSTAHADNLFEQTETRSTSVNATVYMTDGAETLICYGAECWLSNGRLLGLSLYGHGSITRRADLCCWSW